MVCRTTFRAWLVLCVVLFALAQLPAAATTYYVSTTGSDTNPGTQSEPWATIDKGDRDNMLNPGDEVVILEGTYDVSAGAGALIQNRSGTAAQPITYRAEGEAIIDRGTSAGSVIRVYASHVVLDGIRFKGGINSVVFSNCTGCEIRNCWISDKIADYPNTWGPALLINGTVTDFRCHNNVVGPNLPWPSHGIAFDATAGGNAKFFNNVIAGSSDWAFVARTTLPGVEFRNNIIYVGSGGIYSGNASLAHSHNIINGLTGAAYNGTTPGAGEITDDPYFANTSGSFTNLADYELSEFSPAIDTGIYVGLAFNGLKPDMGAFETAGTPGEVGTIEGVVTDANSGAPLSGAMVTLKDAGAAVHQTTAAADGSYSIKWVTGSFTLDASLSGYRPASSNVTVSTGTTTEVNFGLVQATPTTFYVSPTGSDDDPGTQDAPWATMDKGDRDNVLIPGDTVRIQAGTYSGRQVTLGNKDGTAGSPITYVADGTVIIDRADYNGTTWSLVVNAGSHLVFDGITFTGGVGGVNFNDSDSLEIKNCVIRDLQLPAGSGSYYPGIHSVRTGNTYVHNNLLYGTLGHAIVQDYGKTGNRYYNNTIYAYNAVWAFICGWVDGFPGDTSKTSGAEFRNNICYTATGGTLALYTDCIHSNNMMYPAGTPYAQTFGKPGPGEFVADPKFVDEWTPDLHLSAGSPAIDAGALLGLPFNGNWPEIGALEVAGTPNPGNMGTVTGKVTDAVSGTPIAGALVAAGPNSNVTTTTNTNGDYTLQAPLGEQSFSASKLLYEKQTKTDTVTSGTVTVNFALTPVPPKTYYVSTKGNDGNDGLTEGSAWATIDKGDRDRILNPGDTVIVLPGTYDVSSYAGDAPPFALCSGLPGRPITYKSQVKWGAIFDRGSGGGTTLAVRGPSHIVIDGFQLIHGRIPIATVNSTDIEIANCWIHDKNHAEGGWGIWVIGGANHKIHHNVIGPNMLFPCHGIDDYGPVGPNTFYNNTIVGTTDWAFVARSQTLGQEFRNNIISDVSNGIYTENANLVRSHNLYRNVSGTMFASGGFALGEFVADPAAPMFTDSGGNDFTLASGSPAIDAGTPVGFGWNDAWPDLGALESDGVPNSGELATLTGRVIDSASGKGLIAATVSTGANANANATTDADGYYTLRLPLGSQSVTASCGGYTSGTETVEVAGGTQTQDFALAPIPATTYYVSTTGSDSNDGLTPGTAWATLTKGDASGILKPGDTVIVLAGVYDASAGGDGPSITTCSGTANRPITYKAEGDVLFDRSAASGGGVLRIMSPARYIVFDGFRTKGGIYGIATSSSVGNEIKNCWIADKLAGYMGIWIIGGRDHKVHNNVVGPGLPFPCHGIVDDGSLGNNKFYNNTIVGSNDWVFIDGGSGTGDEFINNIAYGAGNGIYGANPNLVHSHNTLNGVSGTMYLGTSAGVGENTDDPLFVDPANRNYRLQAISTMIDTGFNVGLPFAGLAPDRGAFEFAAAFETDKIGEALGQPDGTVVKLTTTVVTVSSGVFSGDVIYVEDESRAAGIRVHAPSTVVSLGDRVSVEGAMSTNSEGERLIEATKITVLSAGSALLPLGTTGRSVSGDGLDDSGILVKIWGNVTFRAADSSYFCVDDGSGKSDGLGHAGIPVVVSDLVTPLASVPSSGYALVTGLVGSRNLGGGVVPVVRPRGDGDID